MGRGRGRGNTLSTDPCQQYKVNRIKHYSASFPSCFSNSFLLMVLCMPPTGSLLEGAVCLGFAPPSREGPCNLCLNLTTFFCPKEMLSVSSPLITSFLPPVTTASLLFFSDSKFSQNFPEWSCGFPPCLVLASLGTLP